MILLRAHRILLLKHLQEKRKDRLRMIQPLLEKLQKRIHLIKNELLFPPQIELKQYCLDFSIFKRTEFLFL